MTDDQTEMTAAQVAKWVRRKAPEIKDGKPTGKTRQVAIKAAEVLAVRDYGDHVVVITTDGKKLRGDKA